MKSYVASFSFLSQLLALGTNAKHVSREKINKLESKHAISFNLFQALNIIRTWLLFVNHLHSISFNIFQSLNVFQTWLLFVNHLHAISLNLFQSLNVIQTWLLFEYTVCIKFWSHQCWVERKIFLPEQIRMLSNSFL